MKDKTPLVLTELIIMLLVFALAAALCLRAFVWADAQSAAAGEREQALRAAERAAETLKACGGDYAAAAADLGGSWDGEVWRVDYDGDWNVADGGTGGSLRVNAVAEALPYLGMAELTVSDAGGAPLGSVQVAWQEVSGDA